jgi:hypothetical protein
MTSAKEDSAVRVATITPYRQPVAFRLLRLLQKVQPTADLVAYILQPCQPSTAGVGHYHRYGRLHVVLRCESFAHVHNDGHRVEPVGERHSEATTVDRY